MAPRGLFRFGLVIVSGPEPGAKRAMSFVDGQNLFHHAKAAFGYRTPNVDPLALARAVCARQRWRHAGVHFYTGVPSPRKNPRWHSYWKRRLFGMRRRGVRATERPLRYHRVEGLLRDGSRGRAEVPQEKGIDICIALDIIRLAAEGRLDVAVLFSQDQDFEEVAREVRRIAARQRRWIKIASAFPTSPTATSRVGIRRTDWIRLDHDFYGSCLDRTDYFADS